MGDAAGEKVYEWKDNSRFSVPAAVAGAAIEEIERRAGTLTPAAVVDAARDPDHPLHPAFNWDDTAAARLYREGQARKLIHSLRVTYVNDGKPPQVAYLSVRVENNSRAYLPAVRVVSDGDYLQQCITDVLRTLRGWEMRHRHLNQMKPVRDVLDRAIAEIEAIAVQEAEAGELVPATA